MERLHVLGTGNAAVTRCYNTCFALETKGEYILCDAGGGNGILRQLKAANIPLHQIHHFILTHAHCDHLLGAVWLLRMIGTAIAGGKYEGELHIYCHQSLWQGLGMMAELMLPRKICDLLGSRILHHPVEDDLSYEVLGHQVQFFDILSTKMLQFGFSFRLNDGGLLCCLGDEPYNPACKAPAADSRWLLSEAFCLYSQRDTFKPYEKHHSTVLDAAKLATQLGTPHLVLWHTEDAGLDTRRETYTQEARQAYEGDLYIPYDLDVIDLV